MNKNYKNNLTKKDISKKINSKIGLSAKYIDILTDDFINILKDLIRVNEVKIKNFGSFKILHKNERFGRNPKNRKIYKITSRKALSFISSKKIIKKLNEI